MQFSSGSRLFSSIYYRSNRISLAYTSPVGNRSLYSSNKLRFGSVRVWYGTICSVAYMLRSSVRNLTDRESVSHTLSHSYSQLVTNVTQ